MNTIANDSTELAECGELAKAFLEIAGSAISEEFEHFGGVKVGEVKGTSLTSASLPWQKILHVGLRRYDLSRTYRVL